MQGPAMVYYKPGCPFGIRLRAALRMRRIPYVAISFRDDETGAAQVRAVNGGNEISPTVRVGDVWLCNPGWRQVASGDVTRVGPEGDPAARRHGGRAGLAT